MKGVNHNLLKRELLQAGASASEVNELLPIASRLSLLKDHNEASVKEITKNRWPAIFKPTAYTVAGIASGMFLVVVSQTALPTSALFPVQKFSDNIAVNIHPQYRANVMMKRAQQVNELVARRAESKQIFAALADYTKEASMYKTGPHTSYAAMEYCKTNLQQAAAAAPQDVRKAISDSLQGLETT